MKRWPNLSCSAAVGVAVVFLASGAAAEPPSAAAGGKGDGGTASEPGKEPGPAEADEPDARVGQARQAFVLGATLAGQQQWADALSAFERSARLRPHPVTTYNLAYCERALGHYTRSYKLFRSSLAEHEAAVTGTLPDDLLVLARSFLPELEHRIARAIVRMRPEAAELSVDGRPLEDATEPGQAKVTLMAGTRDVLGSELPRARDFTLMIDPGRHVLVVSRTGEPDRVSAEPFEAGAVRDLLLDTAPRRDATPASLPHTTDAAPKRKGAGDVAAYASYGVGAAGLILGSIFGIAAVSKKGFLDERCRTPSTCDPRYQGDIDALRRDTVIADIGFGVAVLGAGVGTYFLLGGAPREPSKGQASRPVMEVWMGARGLGARGSF